MSDRKDLLIALNCLTSHSLMVIAGELARAGREYPERSPEKLALNSVEVDLMNKAGERMGDDFIIMYNHWLTSPQFKALPGWFQAHLE